MLQSHGDELRTVAAHNVGKALKLTVYSSKDQFVRGKLRLRPGQCVLAFAASMFDLASFLLLLFFFVSYKNTTAFELLLAEVTLVPRDNWGGDGLLGISVRFTSFEGACENVWHIMVCVCVPVCVCACAHSLLNASAHVHTHTRMHNPALFTVLGRATWLAGSHGTAAVQHRLRRVR